MSVEADDHRDVTSAVKQELFEQGKEATRDAVHLWHAETHDRLIEAAEQRSGTSERPDDSEGKQYRRNNNLTDMLDEVWGPTWSDEEQAWMWGIAHAAAVFHEWGAQGHEIRAKQARALVFEWPDAPQEVREQFEDTFPTVFFNGIEHPGTPAIGMMRYGREQTRNKLQAQGISAKEFGSRGGSP